MDASNAAKLKNEIGLILVDNLEAEVEEGDREYKVFITKIHKTADAVYQHLEKKYGL